jgi:aminoglycoside 3-N-acetyltransferase I
MLIRPKGSAGGSREASARLGYKVVEQRIAVTRPKGSARLLLAFIADCRFRRSRTHMTNLPSYAYRRLQSADVPLLKVLLRVFGEAFGEIDTYQHLVPDDVYLARLLGKDHFIAVVAMADDDVIGGLAAYVLDKFEQDRREIYIYDLAVLGAHRRRGVATCVIGELRRIAAELGAYVIFVQADRDDGPAIALYESLGAKETVYHFDIEVRAEHRVPHRADKE